MGDTFARRLALASISLVLVTGCGSQGTSPGVPAMLQQTQHSSAATSGSMIYVTNPPTQDGGAGSILGFPADADGNVRPTVRIAGKHTGLGFYSTSVTVDRLGRVFSTGTDKYINSVYIWPSGSNGDASPKAILAGVTCGDFAFTPMALTFDRFDHLWVACTGESEPDGRMGGAIEELPALRANATGVYYASSIRLRYIFGAYPGFNGSASVAVKPNGDVSEENSPGSKTILTFAQTASQYKAPRSWFGGRRTQLDGLGGISYDSQGRLVACTNRNSQPRLLTFAAGAHGNVTPISILNVASCKSIAIDPQDNIYVVSATSIIEYAAGATGSATPLRVISGNLTGLTNASSIALKN
jgi:hypothetical protein